MEQRSLCEASNSSPSQEIPHISYPTKLNRRIYKYLSLVPLQSHINPVHAHLSYSFQIYSLLSYIFVSSSSKWSFSTDFRTKTLYAFPFLTIHATGPVHLILLDLITLIMFVICYKSCSSLCCEAKQDLFFSCQNYSINYWISEGVPRRKIVMGMPLYGQSFQLAEASTNGLNARAPGPGQAGEFTRAAGFLAYYEVCHSCFFIVLVDSVRIHCSSQFYKYCFPSPSTRLTREDDLAICAGLLSGFYLYEILM
jgi:Chitinase